MPPKNKRQEEKVKKIVEDKTFGMKNKKKSAKIQKYVEEIKKQAAGPANRKRDQDAAQAPSKKQIEAEKKAQLAELFKPVVQQQKVPFGTNPKTILCAYFKVGQCTKGEKCKFSHDLNIERKSAKIDLYTDKRGGKEEGGEVEESMDNWDQAQLESVIFSKHGNPRPTTDIVCKYFLEAIETSKYGWFWTCPNGGDTCKYRHALPAGYVLKKPGGPAADAMLPEITLEEFLETERARVAGSGVPITLASFTAWKQARRARAEADAAHALRAKRDAHRAGRDQGLSGRDLFTFHPDWAGDDSDAGADLGGAAEAAGETGVVGNGDGGGAAPGPRLDTDNGVGADDLAIDASLFVAEDLEKLALEDLEEGL